MSSRVNLPLREAYRVYAFERCARPLEVDIGLHVRHGYVFAGSELFVLARPVTRGAPACLIMDPSVTFDQPDCWWVYLAVGDIRKMFELMPYPLRWIGFQRKNFLKYYDLCRIKNLVNRTRARSTSRA